VNRALEFFGWSQHLNRKIQLLGAYLDRLVICIVITMIFLRGEFYLVVQKFGKELTNLRGIPKSEEILYFDGESLPDTPLLLTLNKCHIYYLNTRNS